MNREEAKVLIAKRIAREFESAEKTTVINTGLVFRQWCPILSITKM